MGKPHPIELRVRVVAFVEEGNSHRVMERKEPTTGAPSDMSGAPSRPTFTLIVPVDGSMVGEISRTAASTFRDGVESRPTVTLSSSFRPR
jgi:hypothetical protein